MKKFYSILIFTLTLFSCKDKVVDPPVEKKPDTTSHSVTWKIDKIGKWQSHFTNVFGINNNDFWITGTVYLDTPYNASSLYKLSNGKWMPEKFTGVEGQGLIAFDNKTIFVAGSDYNISRSTASVAKYNGKKWKVIYNKGEKMSV